MKKLLTLVIPCFFLAACTGVMLGKPHISMVSEVKVTQSGQEASFAISQKETIEDIYYTIGQGIGYGHRSERTVSDLTDYVRFEIVSRADKPQAFYLYEEDDKTYMEELGHGRWELNRESYERLLKLLKES